jgi:hypothetical protein
MKKYITLFTFICVLFLGVQTATAQQTPELKAKNKTISLQKSLELTSTQVKQVYEIYYAAFEKSEGYLNADLLHLTMKKINNLLQPAQQVEFKKILMVEIEKQEKIEGAN